MRPVALAVLAAIAVVVLTMLGTSGRAANRLVDLGPVPAAIVDDQRASNTAATDAPPLDRFGFRFHRLGIEEIDLWRWNGTFVMYGNKTVVMQLEGSYAYIELDDDTAARFGLATPDAYRLPAGLIGVLCAGIYAFVVRRRRTLRTALILGAVFAAVALVFFLLGVGWASLMPAILALHYTGTAWVAMRAHRNEVTPDADDAPAEPSHRPARSSNPLGPAPTFEKDPFRASPQPPPIVTHHPTGTPARVPVAHDDAAEPPKLLR